MSEPGATSVNHGDPGCTCTTCHIAKRRSHKKSRNGCKSLRRSQAKVWAVRESAHLLCLCFTAADLRFTTRSRRIIRQRWPAAGKETGPPTERLGIGAPTFEPSPRWQYWSIVGYHKFHASQHSSRRRYVSGAFIAFTLDLDGG
ncbi:hypothetical protein CCHL11_08336 [Colletotrichum chlorophyti]|uniref:Uncharacterized protein n=1 Tax=Colletotrichum chlorophyti TaxID=708187 RepID=A0A1Q8RZV1_9PEZI|nr:hypothetical protein CCHL11_08336 [Colletotrichum chlorophyti]